MCPFHVLQHHGLSLSLLPGKVRVEIACRLDSLCVALGEQWSVVTVDILPALVADTDPDVRCEVRTIRQDEKGGN